MIGIDHDIKPILAQHQNEEATHRRIREVVRSRTGQEPVEIELTVIGTRVCTRITMPGGKEIHANAVMVDTDQLSRL